MSGPFDDPAGPRGGALWQALLDANTSGAPPPEPANAAEADFLDLYRPIVTGGTGGTDDPLIIGQLGQSLDGHVATATGASHYINGPENRAHLHRLRALSDAVVVGWRTVAADDPRLTVRHVAGPDPLRVALDMGGRLAADRAMFTDAAPGALRLCAPDTPPLRGVESLEVAADSDGRAEPAAIVAALAARGCRRILIEGGGALVSAFAAAGALDRLHVAVAPLLTGAGRKGLALPPVDRLEDAMRPPCRTHPMGADMLFDLDMAAGGAAP